MIIIAIMVRFADSHRRTTESYAVRIGRWSYCACIRTVGDIRRVHVQNDNTKRVDTLTVPFAYVPTSRRGGKIKNKNDFNRIIIQIRISS